MRSISITQERLYSEKIKESTSLGITKKVTGLLERTNKRQQRKVENSSQDQTQQGGEGHKEKVIQVTL
jgi:hypothetical protein